jgi:hypothetical protein
MQHEVSSPHIVLSTTQTLIALVVGILGFVAASWRVGRAMGEFTSAQNGLAKEVSEGFKSVKETQERHSKSIHDLREKQQQFEVEHAVLVQKVGLRRVD